MPRVKAKKQSSFQFQMLLLVAALLLLIGISTFATLMITGTIEITSSDAEPVESITDAEEVCVDRVKRDYGDMVNAVSVDDFSSRFDPGAEEFKVFYQLDMYRNLNKATGTQLYFVNCFVSIETGKITKMEYLEQEFFHGKPVRRQKGNAFGF